MTFEIAQIIKSKQAYRAQLAARPIAEKLRILEELRKRALTIAASRRKRMRSDSSRIRFSLRFRNSRAVSSRGALKDLVHLHDG